jgi:hypothetical protein
MDPAIGLFRQPKNTLPRIDHIWAFVSVDANDGNEGVVAAPLGGMLMPMIAADDARLQELRPLAAMIAQATGTKIRLIKFNLREEIEEFS